MSLSCIYSFLKLNECVHLWCDIAALLIFKEKVHHIEECSVAKSYKFCFFLPFKLTVKSKLEDYICLHLKARFRIDGFVIVTLNIVPIPDLYQLLDRLAALQMITM